MDAQLIQRFLKQTEIRRAPQRVLATFGATSIDYYLVSPVEDLQGKTRLRQGKVLSEKPKILTAELLARRFEGFGDEAKEFTDWISQNYSQVLRALEYNFKNQDLQTQVISEPPQTVAERILQDFERNERKDQALIVCPDAAWSLALMKLTLDESARSFPTHVRDLERRGLFNPEEALEKRRRQEIERLFDLAGKDSSVLKTLGEKLREYGLFDEYEARFLSFF